MIKTKFTYSVTEGHTITVLAAARDVTSYEAKGLNLKFLDENGDDYDHVMDEETMTTIEDQATEELYNTKYESGSQDLESSLFDMFSEEE